MSALAVADSPAAIMESVILKGDLAQLTPEERVNYYLRTCQSLGLNELTNPFMYVELNGKLTLYATRGATDQLRQIRSVSVEIVSRETLEDVYTVTARATLPNGRVDESTGSVPLLKEDGQWKTGSNGKRFFEKNGKLVPLSPEEVANARMKAETKAKRRVTLSICGLGWIDESELDTVSSARIIHVNPKTGEIPAHAQPDPEPAASAPAEPMANKAQLTELADLGKRLGLDKAGIQAKIGKAGKDLTADEAQRQIYIFKLDVMELEGANQTEPADGSELPGMPADLARYDS